MVKAPKGELSWVRELNDKGEEIYLITSNSVRTIYYLYAINGDKLIKLGKGSSPIDLEKFKKKGARK